MAATSPLLLLSLFMLSVLRYGDAKTPLISVIEALEKLVVFYRNSYRGFNVDGLFGLRVLEGHVQLLLNEHNQGQHQNVSPDVLDRLRKLVKEATQVSNQALEYVKRDDEEYYNSFKFLIGSPWSVYKKHRGIDPNLKWLPGVYRAQKNAKLDEEMSDWCMGEMTGASHKYGRSCVISDKCVKLMTQRGYTEYGLSHQILWTMVAEKAGCTQELKKVIKDSGYSDVEQLQLEFCTNNYYEMLAVVHIYMKGIIRPEYQDLFLELQFVCPSIGFYEHLTGDYLKQILSWQMESGCFGNPNHKKKLSTDNQQKNIKIPDKSQFITNHVNNTDKIGKPSVNSKLWNKLTSQSKPLHFQSIKSQFSKNSQNVLKPPQENTQSDPMKAKSDIVNRQQETKVTSKQAQFVAGQQQGFVREGVKQNQPVVNVGNGLYRPLQHAFNQPENIQPDLNIKRNVYQAVQNIAFINPGNKVNQVPQNQMLKKANNVQQFHLNQQLDGPQGVVGKYKERQQYVAAQGQQRKLLVEKEMNDGCFAHKTAVGAGALAMYLRYLIDPGPLDLNSTHIVLPEASRSLLEKPDISLGDSQKVKKEGLIPVKQKLDEEELALNQMAPALEDREGEGEDLGPDGDGEGGEGGEQSEEYEGDEDEDGDEGVGDEGYEDKEMYPDKDEDVHDRKIVHFGADKKGRPRDVNRFANVDGDGLVDNMGGDHPLKGDNPQGNGDDEEYTYYEETDKEDRNVQQESFKRDTHVKSHHRIKSHNPQENRHLPNSLHGLHELKKQEPLEKTMFVVFSVCFLLLFFLMYRFIKKRRIHIRYHPRTMFSL